MRGRWLKRGGLLLAITVALCCFSIDAYAEGEKEVTEIEVPVYHYYTETETEMSDSARVLQKGAYLADGTIKLVNKGNGVLSIYGSTTGYQKCDNVYLDIYLERSTNGKNYSSYLSWEYTASNAGSLSKSFTKTVPEGYWYRLRGYHAVKESGVKESTSTRTGGTRV